MKDLLELATNSAFCAQFLGIFKTTPKTLHMWFITLHRKALATKLRAMKTFDIWKLRNYISDIKWKREGILKLLVKVWLKFERSFGDLLHINLQKMWPKWLLACLLIITSPSTSSYCFSFSFFGHWHRFTYNRSTKSLLLSQKRSKTGFVNSIFGNIEIKKNF